MKDLSFLEITRFIIHQLPGSIVSDGMLSDELSVLPAKVKELFEGRIRSALSFAGLPIGFVADHASPVPATVTSLLVPSLAEKDFVVGSKIVAQHLFGIQNEVQSEGMLCIAECAGGDAAAIAVIKLEFQDGAHAKPAGAEGHRHFDVAMVDDLMLTRSMRVFKIALFEPTDDRGPIGVACDNQRSRNMMIAAYFLDSFLGCRILSEPSVCTKNFLDTAEAFINTQVDSPILRSQYQAAVMAELSSNRTSVRVRQFADENLRAAHRAPLLAAMTTAEVPRVFAKDIDLIAARLNRILFSFDGDIGVTMPAATPGGDNVKIGGSAGGRTKLEIDAVLKSVRGAR